MTPFPRNTNPRKLNLNEMWELHRLLNTSKGDTLESILLHTHPLKVATAMEILYGSKRISTGQELVWYLSQGLQRNHFRTFLKSTQKG